MDEDEVYQEHITVDLTGCKYVMEFWECIRAAFDFPNFLEKTGMHFGI